MYCCDNANSGLLDIGAWVSIINQSGASYPDAKLKLIAGDVHRAPQPTVRYDMAMKSRRGGIAVAEAAGFEEKSFFEYHLYTLGRPTTIPDNSTKQIELFSPARGVPASKILLYDGAARGLQHYGGPLTDRNLGNQSNTKVEVYLKFRYQAAPPGTLERLIVSRLAGR